jgi:ribosomal protein S17
MYNYKTQEQISMIHLTTPNNHSQFGDIVKIVSSTCIASSVNSAFVLYIATQKYLITLS